MAFFSFYVFGMSRTHDVLPSLYDRASLGSHLIESVNAVGLAFMAHHYRQPELSNLASSKYLTAIRKLNQALRVPQIAVTDATLQSVLLLDLYEKLVNRDSSAPIPWMAHVNGALALVKARGHRNLQNYTARRLCTRLVTTLVVSCAATSTHVPDTLTDLCNSMTQFFDMNDIKWQVASLVISLINLKADIRCGQFSSEVDILENAWVLDSQFAEWHKRFSRFWQPAKVAIAPHSPLVLGKYYDLYQDHYVTQGANVFQTMRLLLHEVIQRHTNQVLPIDNKALETSRKIIEDAARETCASVPQFILVQARPENALPFSPLQVLQGYALLSPLYVAGHFSEDAQLRQWVIDLMKYMAEAGRMEMAIKVAEVLETSPDLPYWNVYAMLGSYAFAA